MNLPFSDPDWITAILMGVAAVVAAYVTRSKSNGKSAPHQEVVRPATPDEKRTADAMTQIADDIRWFRNRAEFGGGSHPSG